ncbi:hypothetical protein P170DRAFT_421949 [Aspergillus steynii IBT 23096]|uniref:RED-like N-terminal domain-containing protein n=1 Tax=Aspergillus steynii IBT 23096 TaxID=1392250 RepID=A0A2I2GR88_9EURO|nr:uncharacterized protein P170DRAFT_421949 [Aspergillus steynii IBT 23096]PLB55388.1 hypothetical protein P170DRAFT_421949 [Aspergillus steynii IBT 23096]
MNNEQFRRLLLDNDSKSQNQKSSQSPKSHGTSRGNATPAPTVASSLGSRLKSSIPMTPRSVGNIDFARQLSDYHREQQQPPSKRFKSSAAPKGTKLPSGYEDRAAKLRALEEAGEGSGNQQGDGEGSGSDLEKRIQALEEMVKLGQIDQATFEKLRGEMGVGGDVGSTHMVKGLDWALLKRVRAGEDINAPKEKEEEKAEENEEDVDEEFDRVLEEKGEGLPSAPKETEPKKKKKGNLAMAPPAAPVPKTRDEILRQLRESRERARSTQMAPPPPPAESVLGARFKKVGDDAPKVEKKRWVEQDENGRRKEILQITDAQGNTKRKVRWLDKPGQSNGGLLVPDKDAKPLGMEVPVEIASKTEAPVEAEDEDNDIFAGVGADYNPLGDLDEDSSSSDSEDETSAGEKKTEERDSADAKLVRDTAAPAVEPTEKPTRPRNYFSTSTSDEPEPVDRSNPLTKDPTLLAALKRAAALRQASPSDEAAEGGDGDEGVDSDTLLRRKKFLEEARRREAQDAMDMDFGFGSSRIEDEEDEEGPTYDEQRGGKKRKRGPKKKKGDKDSVSDVMQVLEGRKK